MSAYILITLLDRYSIKIDEANIMNQRTKRVESAGDAESGRESAGTEFPDLFSV